MEETETAAPAVWGPARLFTFMLLFFFYPDFIAFLSGALEVFVMELALDSGGGAGGPTPGGGNVARWKSGLSELCP